MPLRNNRSENAHRAKSELLSTSALARRLQIIGPLEYTRDIFPQHIAQVKLARKRHSIRALNVSRLRDRHVPVEHPIDSSVPRARLMNQPLYRRRIEVSLDPVRIESGG